MLVSRWVLQAYATLRGESNPNFFANRSERNTYYGTNLTGGQLCAINNNGNDPATVDWNDEVWEVDIYNADSKNWVSVYLDSNFALTITNDGIKALTNANAGQYKLEVSRVAIKQTLLPEGANLTQYNEGMFFNSSQEGYADVCLDTYNTGNTTFGLLHNLTYRTNNLNGGLQLVLELGLDCMGQQINEPSAYSPPTLTRFDLSAIGIFVYDQNGDTSNKEVLFAVANLPAPVEKLTTTPSTIGNSVKLYLNFTLSNLGNTVNVTPIRDLTTSIPEVADESDLIDTYDGVNAPHNIYLVDNYNSTNMPALAVRKGSPLSPNNLINWTYFTPTDDSIEISRDLLDLYDPTDNPNGLRDYMVAAWDATKGKYAPATVSSYKPNAQLAVYVNYHLIYAGKVNNINNSYYYDVQLNNNAASGYKRGETLAYSDTATGVVFVVQIVNIDDLTGKPTEYYITPKAGNVEVTITDQNIGYAIITGQEEGSGLKISVTSVEQNRIVWDFDPTWVGQALYVSKTQPGILTNVKSSEFVGWCLNPHSIKIGLDLRNEATESTYGTTRYATMAEVNTTDGNARQVTSITPETLKCNYLQISVPGSTPDPLNFNGTEGNAKTNRINVKSHVSFEHAIVGSNLQTNNPNEPNYLDPTAITDTISFYGVAYRAQWADLAEYYRADKNYAPGTLICIGSGIHEITEAKTECNGIISTKPGYQLGEKKDSLDLPVALIGKVPVLFAEDCIPTFGDRIYLSKTTPGKASTIPFGKCLGKIIDKDDHLDQKTTIMCSVRIEF